MSFEVLPLWQIFLIFALGSAVLEYTTSWIMEKFFHARWWDYSNLPLNLNGRICLPASILFGVMGILILKYALPFMETALPAMDTFAGELAPLALMAFFSSDVALSMKRVNTKYVK